MTDGRTLHDGIRRAYAYYHAAKIIYSVFQKKWATFIFLPQLWQLQAIQT